MASSFPVYFNDRQQRCTEALPSDFPNKASICNLSRGLEDKFGKIFDELNFLRKELALLKSQNANLNVIITNLRGRVPTNDLQKLEQVSENYERATQAIKSVIESMARVHNVECKEQPQMSMKTTPPHSAVKRTPTPFPSVAGASLPSSMTSFVAPSSTSATATTNKVPTDLKTLQQPMTPPQMPVKTSAMPMQQLITPPPTPVNPPTATPTQQPMTFPPAPVNPPTATQTQQPMSPAPTQTQQPMSPPPMPVKTPTATPVQQPITPTAPLSLPLEIMSTPIVPQDTPIRKSAMAGPMFSQQYSQYPRPLTGMV